MELKNKYLAGVLIGLVAIGSLSWIGLFAHGKSEMVAELSTEKDKVSKGIYLGEGYSLDYNQQQKLQDNEKKNEARAEKAKAEKSQKDNRDEISPYNKNEVIDKSINGSEDATLNSKGKIASGDKDKKPNEGKPNDKPTNNGGNNNDTPNPPVDQDKLPRIETNLKDGKSYPNCLAIFNIRATDYKGKLLGGYYGSLTVLVNGIEDTGAPKKDSQGNVVSRNYNVDLREGANTVEVTAIDPEGRILKLNYTVYGNKPADVPDDEKQYAYVSLNLSNLGIYNRFPRQKMEIFDGEIAVRVIKRYLMENGIEYNIVGGQYGAYLKGMGKPGFIQGCKFTPTQLENIKRDTSIFVEVSEDGSIILDNYDWLQEKNITADAGWMWKLNGIPPQFGMSDQELYEGDVIELFWTNKLGWDAYGGWDPNASWMR